MYISYVLSFLEIYPKEIIRNLLVLKVDKKA